MEFYSKVKDPRELGKVRHELEDVLRIALLGVLCACDDYDEISSGDTIRRVVESVNPDQLRASLGCARERIVSSLKGCHVIIDGKKLRGERRRAGDATASTYLTQWFRSMRSASL